MKYLIVKPVGGLANRIRVMESAYNFASICGAKLVVIWEKNFHLNAGFAECFNPIANAKIIEADYNGKSIISKTKRNLFDTLESVGLFFFTTKKLFDADIEPNLAKGEPTQISKVFFDELAQHNTGIFLETCYEFYPNQTGFRLSIQNSIQQKATSALQNHFSVIGIHIRRTDNIDSISRSPLKKFIEEINNNLKESPADFFYLSTDSEEVVHQLKDLFKEKIITGVTVRNRDSKEGIISGLIDMYCLSQCKKILGSYKSSFSERAAIIGNISLQIVSV